MGVTLQFLQVQLQVHQQAEVRRAAAVDAPPLAAECSGQPATQGLEKHQAALDVPRGAKGMYAV